MLWYVPSPVALESFTVPWYLTSSAVNRDSFWQRKNQQLTWATDLWKVQISYEIRGWCCSCRGRIGLPGVGNSTASIAPLSQVCVSPRFLTLPSPFPLQKQPVLPGGQILLLPMMPSRPERVLGGTDKNHYSELGGNLLMRKRSSVIPSCMLL